MGWKKKAVFSGLITLAALSIYKYRHQVVGPSCGEITYEQVVTDVQKDLIEHRIPQWNKLRTSPLDTRVPDISFDKDNTSRTIDFYLLPVTLSYLQKVSQFFAIYECKSGLIEYSTKN